MKKNCNSIQNTPLNIDNGFDWVNYKFAHPERLIRIATSFSGIGAIEHAFKRLKLKTEIIFAGDIDSECKKAYFANYSITESQWHDDIHDFNASQYKGKVDLFVGGAPCQAFSLRGKHGGFEDTRGTLFREFARVVMECKPKVFIFENVKGMLYHDSGRTWETIRKTFENDCGYQIYFQVLNSKDYGIPQGRDRIYCVGFLNPQEFKFPAPIPLKYKVYDFLEDKVPEKYFLKEKGFKFITQSINHKKSYTQINGTVMLCQKRNQQFNWHGDFIFHPYMPNVAQENQFLELLHNINDGEEDYFVSESCVGYGLAPVGNSMQKMEKNSHIDENIITAGWFRKFTPRECLRLMGFDDSFKIVVSDTETYKQSGNSIVVDVLMAILKIMDITKFGYDG